MNKALTRIFFLNMCYFLWTPTILSKGDLTDQPVGIIATIKQKKKQKKIKRAYKTLILG